MSADASKWWLLKNAAEVPSPSLLIYRDRVDENLRRMLAIAGSPERLRPHIKTHKLPQLVQRQLELGITKFKCATVAEAEMAASVGAPDVLLAYQPVGPNGLRVIELIRKFPGTKFSALVDDAGVVAQLSQLAVDSKVTLELLVDIDVGQHRTGIEAARAAELFRLIASSPGLRAGGLHGYDGHLSDSDPAKRAAACDEAFGGVWKVRDELRASGFELPRIVAGGTPTFPMHARRGDVECSPGTCVLWDAGYGKKLPDLDFLAAALLLTRVVGKPGADRLCLDLGHKAVASEMPHPRVVLLGLEEAQAVTHSEEHLVIETPRAKEFAVGDVIYGVPWHICPTVALHAEAWIVEDGAATLRWPIVARVRRLSV